MITIVCASTNFCSTCNKENIWNENSFFYLVYNNTSKNSIVNVITILIVAPSPSEVQEGLAAVSQ